jgi:hypothetical protein
MGFLKSHKTLKVLDFLISAFGLIRFAFEAALVPAATPPMIKISFFIFRMSTVVRLHIVMIPSRCYAIII